MFPMHISPLASGVSQARNRQKQNSRLIACVCWFLAWFTLRSPKMQAMYFSETSDSLLNAREYNYETSILHTKAVTKNNCDV
jgi:hypothetical protein